MAPQHLQLDSSNQWNVRGVYNWNQHLQIFAQCSNTLIQTVHMSNIGLGYTFLGWVIGHLVVHLEGGDILPLNAREEICHHSNTHTPKRTKHDNHDNRATNGRQYLLLRGRNITHCRLNITNHRFNNRHSLDRSDVVHGTQTATSESTTTTSSTSSSDDARACGGGGSVVQNHTVLTIVVRSQCAARRKHMLRGTGSFQEPGSSVAIVHDLHISRTEMSRRVGVTVKTNSGHIVGGVGIVLRLVRHRNNVLICYNDTGIHGIISIQLDTDGVGGEVGTAVTKLECFRLGDTCCHIQQACVGHLEGNRSHWHAIGSLQTGLRYFHSDVTTAVNLANLSGHLQGGQSGNYRGLSGNQAAHHKLSHRIQDLPGLV